MSAKTAMVNEGLLQEIETRVKTIRGLQNQLVRRRDDPKLSYSEGIEWMSEYDSAVQVLQEVGKQLFSSFDLQDPEDNELERREEEDEEGEDEGDEDEEDEEAEDDE
jgi:hypothetical protein